ncbi:type 4b pilus protein PilO2 [Variovorax paradoxus]|uniref:type 4b pilus protein PilO2 n=1 Tax=Variovorax paradoxus TaxID=34073 RepID=UPI001ABC559B
MASKVVYKTADGKVVLFGGLDWKLLPPTGNVNAHLRSAGAGLGADHAARCIATEADTLPEGKKARLVHRVKAGYYLSSSDAKLPRGAHSLAAAFASMSKDYSSAVLCIDQGESTDEEEAKLVIVVINGLPVFDKVGLGRTEAYSLVASYLKDSPDMAIFSDDPVVYPAAVMHEELLENLAAAVDRHTAIRSLPVDIVTVGAVSLFLAAAVGGFLYWKQWDAEKKRQEAIARQQAEDPIPKYLAALSLARQNVGITRESIAEGLKFARQIPAAPEGWATTRISCTSGAGCEVVFTRTTGTFKGLTQKVPMLELVPAAVANLNEARMAWKQSLEVARLEAAQSLPTLGAFVQGEEASKLQDWLVAGLSIQLSPPMLWPQAEGVPPGFIHPEAIAIGKFEVDSIALPQFEEVVRSAPGNVSWTAWTIDLGDLRQEPLSRAKARLTGNFYVKNS